MDQQIWGRVSLEQEETKYFSVGDLHIWLKYRDEEVWIAHGYTHEFKEEIRAEGPSEDHDWARWAHNAGSGELKVAPVFPDMPLVVHSEYMLKVSPQTKIQIFTRIPVWVQISLSQNDYTLTELPTVKLSRTWFGTPTEGELCYHATTKARRDLSKADKKPYLVSCPILISNESEEELDFEHFCFRVERLSIFEHQNEFWADETQIIYQGTDLNSEVIMTGKVPDGISRDKLVSKPRKQIQKSLATRTFKRIFSEANLLGR